MSKPFKHSSMPPRLERFASSSIPAMSPAAVCRWRRRQMTIWRFCLCILATVVLHGNVTVARAEPSLTNPESIAVAADSFAGFVAEASQRFAIPSSWIRAVMRAESLGDAGALSPKGAMGLMQIIPETWAELRLRYGLGPDPYDPRDNIIAGAAYLRELHDRYGERGFLAAYNAGPGRYDDHLSTGRPLPAETLSYVASVASSIRARIDDGGNIAATMAPAWTSAPLFVPHAPSASMLSRPSSSGQMQQDPADGNATRPTSRAPLSNGLFAPTSDRSGRP